MYLQAFSRIYSNRDRIQHNPPVPVFNTRITFTGLVGFPPYFRSENSLLLLFLPRAVTTLCGIFLTSRDQLFFLRRLLRSAAAAASSGLAHTHAQQNSRWTADPRLRPQRTEQKGNFETVSMGLLRSLLFRTNTILPSIWLYPNNVTINCTDPVVLPCKIRGKTCNKTRRER